MRLTELPQDIAIDSLIMTRQSQPEQYQLYQKIMREDVHRKRTEGQPIEQINDGTKPEEKQQLFKKLLESGVYKRKVVQGTSSINMRERDQDRTSRKPLERFTPTDCGYKTKKQRPL